jgi:hypothetical protein
MIFIMKALSKAIKYILHSLIMLNITMPRVAIMCDIKRHYYVIHLSVIRFGVIILSFIMLNF